MYNGWRWTLLPETACRGRSGPDREAFFDSNWGALVLWPRGRPAPEIHERLTATGDGNSRGRVEKSGFFVTLFPSPRAHGH